MNHAEAPGRKRPCLWCLETRFTSAYQRHGFLYPVSNFQSGRGLHALSKTQARWGSDEGI